MAYKKFIKRGGNVYGPYFYKSRKENGKVITEYLGKSEDKSADKIKSKKLHIIFLILGLVVILSSVIFFNSSLTGRVALQVQNNYLPGEQINGNLELSLKQGELLPAGTKVLIENGGEVSEFLLSDLISGNLVNGQFYAEGTSISGNGQGYGIIGEKKIYPDVYFELQIVGKGVEEPETAPTEIESEKPVEAIPPTAVSKPENVETTPVIEQTSTEKSKEKSKEEKQDKKTESSSEIISNADAVPENTEASSSSESSSESASSDSRSSESSSSENSAGITGEIVQGNSVEGKVSKDNPFTYELPSEKSAKDTLAGHENLQSSGSNKFSVKVKPNSVRTESTELSESDINLKVSPRDDSGESSNSVAVVTTDYYETEQGFGEDYLTNEKINFNIDLSQFGLVAKQGQLIIKLVYSDVEISSVSKNIYVEGEEPVINETEIPETNITETPVQNITEQNVTIVNEINVSVIENLSSLQYKAIAGRPVKWIKIIKTTNETDLIEIPKKSNNITIKTGDEVQQALNELAEYENTVDNADRNEMADGTLTGMVSLDINENKGFLRKLIDWLSKFGLTGNVIQESEMQNSIIETNNSKIVEIDKIVNVTDGTNVAVEYYTEPSTVVEENLTNGKRITISADDEFNYTDILAYSLIDKNISMQDLNKVRLYWYSDEIADEIVENATEETINQIIQTNELLINESITEPTGEANESLITGQVVEEINSNIPVKSKVKTEVNFTAYDLDSDGDVDYVEWIVPHLSSQVYEIIYITKAEHLDANRIFISDIYDAVKSQDGIWSETINDSEYVRVTFEQMLDSTKDITIYARAGCNNTILINGVEVPCEIYEKKMRIDEIRRLLE